MNVANTFTLSPYRTIIGARINVASVCCDLPLKSIFNMRHQEWDNEVEVLASRTPTVDRAATDAEIESDVDNWCREMGIS